MTRLEKFLGHKKLHQAENSVSAEQTDEGNSLDVAIYKSDPGMTVGIFEAVERLSKGQVPDKIERSLGILAHHALRTFGRVLVKALDQKVDVLPNQRLLLAEPFPGKRVCKEPLVARMILASCS